MSARSNARSDPRTYDTAEKFRYRDRLYSYLRDSRHWGHAEDGGPFIAIMDTHAAHEAIHAVRSGVKAERIYVCNNDVPAKSRAAWKATFTRAMRAALPSVVERPRVFPGVDMLTMVRDMRPEYGWGLVNFDSCAPINGLVWADYVNALVCYGAPCVFAITIMAGREQPNAFANIISPYEIARARMEANRVGPGRLGEVAGNHHARLQAIHNAIENNGTGISGKNTDYAVFELYRSRSAPMLHFACHVVVRNPFHRLYSRNPMVMRSCPTP